MIFIPLLFGQMIARSLGYQIDWLMFAIIHSYGLCIQLYIVYANDYADIETDKINTTFNIFSGGSRVLAEELIEPKKIGYAAIITAFFTLEFASTAAILYHRYLTITRAAFSLILLYMYS